MSLDNIELSDATHLASHRGIERLRPFKQFIRSAMLTRNTSRLLFILFVSAFLLRATYAAIIVSVDPMLNGDPLLGDAASYDRIARSLVAGTGFAEAPAEPSAFWPPLYPAFLASIYWVTGHHLVIARLANAALGALVPVVIFMIGMRLFDRRIALLAALGSVAYPLLIVLGAWVIPDGPYVLAVCLILLLMTEIQSTPRIRWYVALGILLGLSFMLKPVTAFFFPFLVAWFLIAVPKPHMRQRLMAGIITIIALIIVVAPWTIRNQIVLDSLIVGSSNGGYTFYGANNPDAFGGHYEHFPTRMPELTEGDEQRKFYRLGLTWIAENPRAFLSVEVQKFRRLISPLSISSNPDDLSIPGERVVRSGYAIFLILAVAGIIISLRRQWRDTLLLLVPVLGVLLSTAVFYGDTRYTMPMIPVLLLSTSVTVVAVRDMVTAVVARRSGSGSTWWPYLNPRRG